MADTTKKIRAIKQTLQGIIINEKSEVEEIAVYPMIEEDCIFDENGNNLSQKIEKLDVVIDGADVAENDILGMIKGSLDTVITEDGSVTIPKLAEKVDKTDGMVLSTNDFTNEEKEKLSKINTAKTDTLGLVKGSTDVEITTDASITVPKLADKVDVMAGKKLSSNDFTDEEQAKLRGIAENATNYTHPVWDVIGSYNRVIVDEQGHVTGGKNDDYLLSEGGTGATDATTARINLGIPYGNTEGTACTGNDSRLSDVREALAHEQSADSVISGELSGATSANADAVTALETAQVRNIYAGNEDLIAGVSSLTTGDIYLYYEEATE